MKFQLAINLERNDDSISMEEVQRHTLEMVQMADRGGIHIVWAAEHHALEMTIAPDPFQILTWWAAHTNDIRLGTAVAVAPYWHPIKLAGEAAFTDLISGGRLEFGIGSGAYQREFDRMLPGVKQSEGYRYMHEMLPALKALWAGDYEHNGEFWQFPTSTSVPKPVQKPHPPIWVAARAPVTFNWAIENGCHIMSWPFTRPFAEAEMYKERLDEAMALYPDAARPTFAMMRHAVVYDTKKDSAAPIEAIQNQFCKFANLYQNLGDVENGFPKQVPLESLGNKEEYSEENLLENLMFGTPDEIIAKLKRYEALGVDEFIFYCSMGLGHKEQKRSMELLCSEVMPAFA
jgi:alkanesulfonate monooxygenase SsuD/methylene tetrahydromethanopterin reductase-like flavin-dependent oxidoreductase (luciferase family)